MDADVRPVVVMLTDVRWAGVVRSAGAILDVTGPPRSFAVFAQQRIEYRLGIAAAVVELSAAERREREKI